MQHSSFQIRLATPLDVDLIAPLFDAYRQFYEQAADLEGARSFILDRLTRQESHILLAEHDDHALGFIQLYPSFCSILAEPIYLLSDLFVLPVLRKSGAGRALMLEAEQLALANGKARLDLTTAKTNLQAQSLYESLGWQRDEVYYAYTRTPGAACNLGDCEVGEFID
ncbi:MAG: GNAT family N-acetyltransferase [Burkholderiales bacterium]|nr:GNAT family N-acetyltransferase [Burkholderiales bacterium]